jgi:hypothetical protein
MSSKGGSVMPDRCRYVEVRQKIIDAIRTDLIGPEFPEEILDENPRFAYLVGMLVPQQSSNVTDENEQEIEADVAHGEENDFSADEDDENEPITTTRFQLPSSVGISFYVKSDLDGVNIDVTWGDYVKSTEPRTGKDGKERSITFYRRIPKKETVYVRFREFEKIIDYPLMQDSNIHVHVSRILLKSGYFLVTVNLVNKRTNPANDVEGVMFQVGLKAYAEDASAVFVAEHYCRKIITPDEFYFEERPIMGRGRGCAAVWGKVENGRTDHIESAFIPEYELPGVSFSLENLPPTYFSAGRMGKKENKSETIGKLNTLADSYEEWIDNTLARSTKMENPDFRRNIGDSVIERCRTALSRIRNGIHLIENDEKAFEAFCFMNAVIFMQNSIKNYAKKHGAHISCRFGDFTNLKNRDNEFAWRPFQIAFILMNINGIVHPETPERDIVDLLYFPTGGGKTEAYLGLMAFTIANRRLRISETDQYNRDGGVTIILRYTLRLLTTQQRDRITRMVVAAEILRRKKYPKYGTEPISIGFWVGGGITPNNFASLKLNSNNYSEVTKQRKLIYRQMLNCPFCGEHLTETNFHIDADKKSVEIYCPNVDCMFYKEEEGKKGKEKGKESIPMPVYLVDEEIYAKCPTIILSTVDKFARLPWDVHTNALFGRVDRKCSRDGYIAIGAEHPMKHNKNDVLPAASVTTVKSFLPPELIIQDELHLITGPLGTIYGGYETTIEDLCTHDGIKPKYVVSTATIKNAEIQARSLYARKKSAQFPPHGFEIGDSFFIREIPVDKKTFRKYIGICAPGQSMKTALLRIYAIILQSVKSYSDEYKDVIDPYYTLIGYFNSIRELGGAVRLLQDDIPERIKRLQKRYKLKERRRLNRNIEITSRMPSWQIPEKLNQLENSYDSGKCLDTAVATNMIAVGMDVDRLGLMVVTGQPKQNSEYIQATSRIGRLYPGLVVTLYNAYRPRDLSHYENFTGYHSQLYRFVEGTTATPFSARARDRVLHALVISAIRLLYPEMAANRDAGKIVSLSQEQLDAVKQMILSRVKIVKPSAVADTGDEIDQFIEWWKFKAKEAEETQENKSLLYYHRDSRKYDILISPYDKRHEDRCKPTLQSMREVESPSNMFYFTDTED